jgi:diguanylate cyclase (GGDEF)-like protein/PAS domain S-box-containing protein
MASTEAVDFQFLTENSADIICRIAPDQTMAYVSPASFPILGWTPEEMIAMPPFAIVHPEDIPGIQAAMERSILEGVPTPAAGRTRKKDGTFIWMEATGRVQRNPVTGELLETVVVMRDINDRKLLEEKLAALSKTDGLTGLANRRAFDEALELEWMRTLREGSQMSLLLLDIDRFKRFNDSYGHQCGDDCLRTVAAAVRDGVRRAIDVVARYGGEEIVAILPSTDLTGAVAIAESVRCAIEALGIPHAGNSEAGGIVTASIGVATALARHGATARMPESLLMSADHALYKAKHEGRNRVGTALLMASQDVTATNGFGLVESK